MAAEGLFSLVVPEPYPGTIVTGGGESDTLGRAGHSIMALSARSFVINCAAGFPERLKRAKEAGHLQSTVAYAGYVQPILLNLAESC